MEATVNICNFVDQKVFVKSTQLYCCSIIATIDYTSVSKWGYIPIKLFEFITFSWVKKYSFFKKPFKYVKTLADGCTKLGARRIWPIGLA